jgi:hypothetical protein
MKVTALAAATVALMGAAGCGETASNAQASPTPTDVLEQGYMSQGDTYVMFVQFDTTGQQLSGSLYQASFSPSGQDGVATQTFSFGGTRQGNVIVLNVSSGGQWTATLDGSTLRLRYTDTQGLPAIATLTGSSIDAYDSSVQGERAMLSEGGAGCTVEYPNHYATVTVSGVFGGQQASQICADAMSQGYVTVPADASEGIVCIVGSWGVSAVVVRDTGGQIIGSQICKWVQRDGGPTPTWASTPATFY